MTGPFGMATAIAHPNIALVKYWGKQTGPGNRPATPSLSITVAGLTTTTRVEAAERDSVCINGERRREPKVETLLDAMRGAFDLPPVAIDTRNDFPTGAGLASSASGFAALVTALDGEFDLGMSCASTGNVVGSRRSRRYSTPCAVPSTCHR